MEAAPFRENVYGHLQRLQWLRAHLKREDRVVEFGCGTGRLITVPLRTWGYDVVGVDLDERSIEDGRALLREAGLDEDALRAVDLRDLPGPFDAVIASEILEHLDDRELAASLALIRERLAPGGTLLVTTPNGYSLFELENLLWYRTGVDRLYRRLSSRKLAHRLRRMKAERADWSEVPEPMTLADSPHKQRFTWRSIHRILVESGFDVVEARGAILFCGPFTDIAFSGFPRVMALNKKLGRRLPRIASDYYVAAVKRA
jgi:SAM-dependent methyltransferase